MQFPGIINCTLLQHCK